MGKGQSALLIELQTFSPASGPSRNMTEEAEQSTVQNPPKAASVGIVHTTQLEQTTGRLTKASAATASATSPTSSASVSCTAETAATSTATATSASRNETHSVEDCKIDVKRRV